MIPLHCNAATVLNLVYAWYRLLVSMDSLPATNLAFAAPPAVDDAY